MIQQDPLNPGYSTIKTTGRSENAKEAIAYIDANLPRTMSMDIHPDDIGWIIGRSGDNIRSLQVKFMLHSCMKRSPDLDPLPTERVKK